MKFYQESKAEKLDLQVALLVLVDLAVLFHLHHQALPFIIKGKHEVKQFRTSVLNTVQMGVRRRSPG